MPVLDRNELEQSPLADLHAIASELGIEGYRRLRRDDLIDALVSGDAPSSEPKGGSDDSDDAGADRPRRRRGGRGRGKRTDEDDNGAPAERPARSGGGRGQKDDREERAERAPRAREDR